MVEEQLTNQNEKHRLFIINKDGKPEKIEAMPEDKYYFDLFARSKDDFVKNENEKYPSSMGTFLASRLRETGDIVLFFGSLNPNNIDKYNTLYMYLPLDYLSTKPKKTLRELLEKLFPDKTIQDKKYDIIICSNKVIPLLKTNNYTIDTGDGIEKKVDTVDKMMEIIEKAIYPEGYFKYDENAEHDDDIKCSFHLKTVYSTSSDDISEQFYEEFKNRDELNRIKDDILINRNNNRIVLDCVVDAEERKLYARLYISLDYFEENNNEENKKARQEYWRILLSGLRRFVYKFSDDGFEINTMLLTDNKPEKSDIRIIYSEENQNKKSDVIQTIIKSIESEIEKNNVVER